jgi:hypothetical protein
MGLYGRLRSLNSFPRYLTHLRCALLRLVLNGITYLATLWTLIIMMPEAEYRASRHCR